MFIQIITKKENYLLNASSLVMFKSYNETRLLKIQFVEGEENFEDVCDATLIFDNGTTVPVV